MRKIFLAAGLLLLLTACTAPREAVTPTPPPVAVATPIPASEEDAPGLPFEIQSPIRFASYEFGAEYPELEGKTLLLECISGAYDASRSTWNRAWQGEFRFRVAEARFLNFDGPDSGVMSCPLSLTLNGEFPLVVDDYNGDGQPDFILTQFGGMSSGDGCTMFTVKPDGAVEQVPVTGDSRGLTFYAPGTEGENFSLPYIHRWNSFAPTRTEDGFYIETPSLAGHEYASCFLFEPEAFARWNEENLAGDVTLRDTYQWQEGHFALVRQEILREDGGVWLSSDTAAP